MDNFAKASEATRRMLTELTNVVRSDYSEASNKVDGFLDALAKAGFGREKFYDGQWGWLIAAAADELNIPQVAFKGEFRGWRVANGQIYTVNEKLGVMTLCKNGEQVYQGPLARWFLDEEGNWYMEQCREPEFKGTMLFCGNTLVYQGACGQPRASQGCLYVPLDVDYGVDRVDRISAPLYKFSPDGSKEHISDFTRVEKWFVSKGHVFTITTESGKTILSRDSCRFEEVEKSDLPHSLKIRNGRVFILDPRFPAGVRCYAGVHTVTPDCFDSVLKDMKFVDWYPYKEGEGPCVIFAELKNKETGLTEIWKWPEYYHRIWTLPMADYRVDGNSLYIRVFQLTGQSVILRLADL